MISFATSGRFSIALTLLVGAFAHNVIAELPLSLDAGTLNGGKVLVNNGGTLLDGHATISNSQTDPSKAIRSQTAALTMEPKDMTARTSHDELDNSALPLGHDALPLSLGDFPSAPTNISYLAPSDGTDAVGGTFTTASLLKAAELSVHDSNDATGLEDEIRVEPIPEPSTWCVAALLAMFVGFQCHRKFTRNAGQMRPLPISASKPSQARALAPSSEF